MVQVKKILEPDPDLNYIKSKYSTLEFTKKSMLSIEEGYTEEKAKVVTSVWGKNLFNCLEQF